MQNRRNGLLLCGGCGAERKIDEQYCESCGAGWEVKEVISPTQPARDTSQGQGGPSDTDGPTARSRPNWLVIVIVAVLTVILSVVTTTLLIRSPVQSTENADLSSPARVRITAQASSIRNSTGSLTYLAGHAIDGNLATAWIEGTDGPGIGEWIRFDFDREVELLRVRLAPGYFKSSTTWVRNNRLAMVTLYLSDGTKREWQLDDRMEQQELDLKGARTHWVRMTIERIYPGSKDSEDSPLSEITFDFKTNKSQ